MKASLCIESIGDNNRPTGIMKALIGPLPRSHWIAEIIGFDDEFYYKRMFLKGNHDYSDSNSVGSRGIMICYVLESGHIYEVKHKTSWNKSKRYFCIVYDEEIKKVEEDYVKWFLNQNALG